MGNWYATTSPENKYQYNGKELNEELGLNWNDYGARYYDPAIARWNAVDPLADNPDNIFASPYCYVLNNPIILIDLPLTSFILSMISLSKRIPDL